MTFASQTLVSAIVAAARRKAALRPRRSTRAFPAAVAWSLAVMNLPLIFVGAILAQGLTVAASNGATLIQTNYVSDFTLSGSELDAVVQLSNVCGITNVISVSTEGHLDGISIVICGDEKIEARTVRWKTLRARRVGWRGGKLPATAPRLVGEFWVDSTTRPQEEERTIVRVGDRTYRVILSNGIKPEGADKVIGAFVNGRVRYDSDDMKYQAERIGFTQPTWLGVSGGQNCISFSHERHSTQIKFHLNADEVTVHEVTGPDFSARYE